MAEAMRARTLDAGLAVTTRSAAVNLSGSSALSIGAPD
jgi:hypothetical protein